MRPLGSPAPPFTDEKTEGRERLQGGPQVRRREWEQNRVLWVILGSLQRGARLKLRRFAGFPEPGRVHCHGNRPRPRLRVFHDPNKVVVEAQRDHVSRPGAELGAEPEAGAGPS